jgi:nucleoside-diphosphate-sugar epimerase
MYADGWGLETLLANSLGTKNLLDFALKCEAKFLLVSSIDVYQGLLSSLNLAHYFGKTEFEERKYSLIEAKRYAEALVWEYYKKYDMNARIVRLPKIYGPRMPLNSNEDLNSAIKDLLEDRDLKLFGEGTEKNYYLYITDAVSGLVKALFAEDTKGKIYSLSADEPYTTLEIIYLLKNLASRELNIEFKPKTGELPHRFVEPDTTNLHELSWEQKIPFKEGISKTLKWYGYEINEHSFKPAKIIADKENQKQADTTSILPQQEAAKPVPTPVVHKPSWWEKYKAKKKQVKKPQQVVEVQPAPVKVKSATEVKSTSKTRTSTTRATLQLVGILFLILLFIVGTPLVQTAYFTMNASRQLSVLPTNLGQLDINTAQSNANKAYIGFQKAQNTLKFTSWLFKITGQQKRYETYQNTLVSAEYFSKAVYYTSKAGAPFSNIWSVIRIDRPTRITTQDLYNMDFNLKTAKANYVMAHALAKTIDENKYPKAYRGRINQYKDATGLSVSMAGDAEKLMTDLPELLGIDKPKKYLILFQNSNELRPTGGFIGSYAVLELEEGKIKSLKIDDIYNPDGQLEDNEVRIASPNPIKELLAEESLFIRNANWNPDFKKSAQTITALFADVDGSTFDGVVAIDLEVIKNMLKVTGPVYLTAYNEEINADNLYERTQFHSEFNYKEGQSQKKTFLTVLGSKFLEKVFSLQPKDMPKLMDAFALSLQNKHILISNPNTQTSTLLEKYGWDGSLHKQKGDYLYVVNANLGGNKANYYVKNKMNYEVTGQTRDGIMRGTLTLEYKHMGKDLAWPGGTYKNYVRVLTQKGTKLTGAELTLYDKQGRVIKMEEGPVIGPKTLADLTEEETKGVFSKNTTNPANLITKAVIETQGAYTSYGFLVDVNPQETAKLSIKYDLGEQFKQTKQSSNYTLYWQKQPGTVEDQITFKLTAPFGKTITDALTKKPYGNQFFTSGTLIKDTSFTLSLN